MFRRLFKFVGVVLLLGMACGSGHAASLSSYPTATLTVSGAETSINSLWDSGPVTVSFNGFSETISYGQFSSPSSLAAGLAAMFSRDYHYAGLYAKAGANSNQDPTVITFQLANGGTFGAISITGSTVSFAFTPSGFYANPSQGPGVATLSFNGATIATANYDSSSTSTSLAQALAQSASSSMVTVTAEGSSVFLQAAATAGNFNAPYSLTFSTSNFFSSPSASGQFVYGGPINPASAYNYVESYAADGNVSGVTDSVMGAWSYGYDGLSRLTSAQDTSSGGTYAGKYGCWTYDNFGNRLTQSLSTTPCTSGPTPMLAATYSSNNQISSLTTTSSTTTSSLTVTYDSAGNMTSDGYNTYTYDAEGRVCALNGPSGQIGYQYDADGNRIGKGTVTNWQSCDITTNGYTPTTDFVLDQGGGQMTEVAVGGGSSVWQHTNVTANGTLIATYDTTGLHFYLNDALGSRRVQTDSSGNTEQFCQSLPYGDQLYCSGSLTSPTEHHFTGKERDSESGLDYFPARYLSNNMGRWTSPDSVGGMLASPQTLNRYAYVNNNPLRFSDRLGLCASAGDDKQQSSGVIHCTLNANADGTPVQGSLLCDCQNNNIDLSAMLTSGTTFTPGTAGNDPGQNDDSFAPGSLAYNTFGPPSLQTWGAANKAVTYATVGYGAAVGGAAAAPAIAGGLGAAVSSAAGAFADSAGLLTSSVNRVFWSGAGYFGATRFAEMTGGSTLEMTFVGKVLGIFTQSEEGGFGFGWETMSPLWGRASAAFASGAQGTTMMFQNIQGTGGYFWNNIESGILRAHDIPIVQVPF